MQLLSTILFFGFASAAFAAGNGGEHHGHVTDLIAPVVNVVVLVGFLVWKLKKPLGDMFTKQAEEISNTLERASLKSKEAEVMLKSQEKKMSNLENEIKEINRATENEIKNFEKTYAREIEEKSFKLKIDATAKIEAERKAITDELHATLLDEVINKAKSTIRGNKDYQAKASSRMLGEMVQ